MAEKFEAKLNQTEKGRNELSTQLVEILPGIKIEKLESDKNEGNEIFRLDIKDREAFNRALASGKMIDIFGAALLRLFGPRNNSLKIDIKNEKIREAASALLKDGDFTVSDSIYISAKNGELVSFLAGTELDINEKDPAYFINVGFTIPQKRKQGNIGELNQRLFSERKYAAILSTTVNKSAVNQSLQAAKDNNYEGFYCGYHNGDLKDQGTLKQQEKIKKIDEVIKKIYVDLGITIAPDKMPANHIIVRADTDPMPPVTKEDLHFKAGDPLKDIFEKEVLALQQKFLPDSDYCELICLRND